MGPTDRGRRGRVTYATRRKKGEGTVANPPSGTRGRVLPLATKIKGTEKGKESV